MDHTGRADGCVCMRAGVSLTLFLLVLGDVERVNSRQGQRTFSYIVGRQK